MTRPLATVPHGPSTTAELLRNLEKHARHARGAYAENTERALRADIVVFTAWCAGAGLAHLPATSETVIAFVDAIAGSRAPATIRRYVSSIATLHRAARLPNPTEAMEVKLALKRLHREKGRAQAQAAPLNRGMVERMLLPASPGLRGLRNRALLVVAYDTLCRRSELIGLLREDLEFGPDGDGTVAIRRSKTDQEGAGAVCYLAPDTVRVLRAWTEAAGITAGPIFRSVAKGGLLGGALDSKDVSRLFKAMALAAGLTPEEVQRISGHSSRVGAAQDMVRHGVDLPAVMLAGRWRSPEMVERYTRRLDARRSGAAKLAERQGRT